MFYGWKLAILGSFGNFMLFGGVLYVMNAFIEPLSDSHGWSRTDMSLSMGIASLCGTLSMSFVAYLASKVSLRYMITLSALIGGIAFISLGYVSNLLLFTLFFSIVWITGQACGGVAANVLMQKWFILYRGRAFGVVNIGASLSGAILPFVALFLVDNIGIQWAYTFLGSLVLVAVPFYYFMIRDTPEELGMSPDGIAPVEELLQKAPANDPNPSTQISSPEIQPLPTAKELMRNPIIWMIGIIFGIGLMTAAGIVSQLKPRFVDLGFDSYTAMSWMCLTALCAAIGKYAWGWVSDRITPLKAVKLALLGNVLSLSLSFLPQTTMNVLFFAVTYGLCFGGLWSLFPAIIAYMFGHQTFLLAYRIISAFIVLKAFGYPIIGMSYDITGNYNAAYALFIGALFIAFLLTLCMKETQAFEYNDKQAR